MPNDGITADYRNGTLIGRVMARVSDNLPNGGLLKVTLSTCAVFFTIIVAMLGYWISMQHELIEETRTIQNVNGNRLSIIETRINGIEQQIRNE